MSYRVCRHLTTSTFQVGDQICKIFMEPEAEYRPGYWMWNIGFAVGKSKRQLNDWYWRRKNKRRRSLDKHVVGLSGMKTIARGAKELFQTLRWKIEPGDGIKVDCTSKDPESQFRGFHRWIKNHPEWVVDYNRKEFYWYRPPYADDPIRKDFLITPIIPSDPLASTDQEHYFDCFLVQPKVPCTELSMEQMLALLNQAL